MDDSVLDNIRATLQAGGIIAYPTEAVFGLGCDPFNEKAVAQIRALKQRSEDNGLIIVTDCWSRCESWVTPLPAERMQTILATWPGHDTWIFSANEQAPQAVLGPDETIAIRVSDHPIVQQICRAYGNAIVSTSANKHGEPPAMTADDVSKIFGDAIDVIVDAPLGKDTKPSTIRDARDGTIIRK